MFSALADFIIERGSKKPVDLWIGGEEDPYVVRRHLIPRNFFFNIYLHNIKRSDDPRAPHDHRSFTISWILKGGYVEHLFWRHYERVQKWRGAGDIVFRSPWTAHRLDLPNHPVEETWTVFITLPRLRTWGFWCRKGWVPHEYFTAGPNGELVGRGCE